MPSARHNLRGSTLLEVLVAVTVLTVSLVAALASQANSGKLMTEAQETELAVQLLRATMAELQSQTVEELCESDGDYAPGKELAVDASLADQVLRYETPGYTSGDPAPTILSLRVTLDWTSETGHARQLELLDAKRQ